jgi:hypothetical protein
MKKLIIAISFCIIVGACRDENYVPDCVCTNLEKIKTYDLQEGIIIFPRLPISVPYAMYEIIPQNDFVGSGRWRYIICTDSNLITQIKNKQIKDSSRVLMTDIGLLQEGICNQLFQRTVLTQLPDLPNPRIRVKTIEKK